MVTENGGSVIPVEIWVCRPETSRKHSGKILYGLAYICDCAPMLYLLPEVLMLMQRTRECRWPSSSQNVTNILKSDNGQLRARALPMYWTENLNTSDIHGHHSKNPSFHSKGVSMIHTTTTLNASVTPKAVSNWTTPWPHERRFRRARPVNAATTPKYPNVSISAVPRPKQCI